MNQQQIIKELEELVEMASFKIEADEWVQEDYTVVEISDIERLINKLKTQRNDF